MIPKEKFSVIIPAKNEEFVIQEIIESCCHYASVIIFIYRQVATLAKKINSNIKSIFFGVHPWALPNETFLENTDVEYIAIDTLTNLNFFSYIYRLGKFSRNYYFICLFFSQMKKDQK